MRSVLAVIGLAPRSGDSSLRAQMVRGTTGTLGVKLVNAGLTLLTSVVLARSLGAKGYGAYAYAVSWVSLLLIPATMGLDTLLTREAARCRTTDNWPVLKGVLSWSDHVVLPAALMIAAGIAAAVWLWAESLDPIVVDCLWASIPLLPVMAVIQLRGGSTRGLGKVIAAQVPMLVVLPLVFLGAVLVLHLVADLSAPRVVALRTAGAVLAAAVAVWLLHRILPAEVRSALPEYHRRSWLKSAVPFLFLNAAVILNQQVGVVMLGSMVGPAAAGVYDVARRMAMLVSFVLLAVNMPLGPIVANLYARGEIERLQRIVVKGARVAAAGSCVIAFALIILGPWILRLFGEGFTAGLPVLTILCLGEILSAAAGSVGLVLNMTGHERDTLRGVGVAAIGNVLLSALLIPLWGIFGAALAGAISTALWNVLLIIWMRRHVGLNSTVLGSWTPPSAGLLGRRGGRRQDHG
jgi:O-antigen/teichoic acid export membrane protein